MSFHFDHIPHQMTLTSFIYSRALINTPRTSKTRKLLHLEAFWISLHHPISFLKRTSINRIENLTTSVSQSRIYFLKLWKDKWKVWSPLWFEVEKYNRSQPTWLFFNGAPFLRWFAIPQDHLRLFKIHARLFSSAVIMLATDINKMFQRTFKILMRTEVFLNIWLDFVVFFVISSSSNYFTFIH